MKYIYTFLFAIALVFAPFKETKAQFYNIFPFLSSPGEGLFYNTSVGIKFEIPPYLQNRKLSISATGKHFLNNNHAIEGIVNYRHFDNRPNPTLDDWNWFRISGLYLIHSSLKDIQSGLDFYIGGGAYIGFLGGNYNFSGAEYNSIFSGISLSIGLDWSLEEWPINVSLDWIPSYGLTSENQELYSGFSGFTGHQGGISLRYILR